MPPDSPHRKKIAHLVAFSLDFYGGAFGNIVCRDGEALYKTAYTAYTACTMAYIFYIAVGPACTIKSENKSDGMGLTSEKPIVNLCWNNEI